MNSDSRVPHSLKRVATLALATAAASVMLLPGAQGAGASAAQQAGSAAQVSSLTVAHEKPILGCGHRHCGSCWRGHRHRRHHCDGHRGSHGFRGSPARHDRHDDDHGRDQRNDRDDNDRDNDRDDNDAFITDRAITDQGDTDRDDNNAFITDRTTTDRTTTDRRTTDRRTTDRTTTDRTTTDRDSNGRCLLWLGGSSNSNGRNCVCDDD